MIKKLTVIVTSLGRTGTQFFANLLRDLLPDATSLHEPDYFNVGQYAGTRIGLQEAARQIKESRFSNLVLRKMMGRWNLVALSDARIRGEMSVAEAGHHLRQQRADFVHSRPGTLYAESSSAYYGLLDVLPLVYSQHRAIYIVRDGRDWVRSKMNWGKMYAKSGWRSRLSHTWPTALDFPGDVWHDRWPDMTRFERICWAWARLNRFAVAGIGDNPHARLFRFEDIFLADKRYQVLTELITFATSFPGLHPLAPGALDGRLETISHQSQGHFPRWSAWSAAQRDQFLALCGPLMAELGYELD